MDEYDRQVEDHPEDDFAEMAIALKQLGPEERAYRVISAIFSAEDTPDNRLNIFRILEMSTQLPQYDKAFERYFFEHFPMPVKKPTTFQKLLRREWRKREKQHL